MTRYLYEGPRNHVAPLMRTEMDKQKRQQLRRQGTKINDYRVHQLQCEHPVLPSEIELPLQIKQCLFSCATPEIESWRRGEWSSELLSQANRGKLCCYDRCTCSEPVVGVWPCCFSFRAISCMADYRPINRQWFIHLPLLQQMDPLSPVPDGRSSIL